MVRKRNQQIPGVFWRLFRNKARTLSQTIVSMLPYFPQSLSRHRCHCNDNGCLGCSNDAMSFLLRDNDPYDYCKLLQNSYVVVSENAPTIRSFVPHSHCSQYQIVKSIIELMLYEVSSASANVLCSDYDRSLCSSSNVEHLSCASWNLLLSRIGADFMVYLLKNTSIFLPVLHGKHCQVAGPPISSLCYNMKKCSSKFDIQHPPLRKRGAQKRKRSVDVDDRTAQKQKRQIPCNTDGPVEFASNAGLTDKSSMQPGRYHGTGSNDVSVSEATESTITSTSTDNDIRKEESEGKPDLNCITTRPRKRSRPCPSKRLRCKLQKQSTIEDDNTNLQSNLLPTNTDSFHEKMLRKCSCCLILHSLPTVPKGTDINRKYIFYNLESSLSVLPKKHILHSLKPNVACSKYLIGNIFGFSDVNANAQPMSCSHISGSCLVDSACLYHSLVKSFKNLIRRARCCQPAKFLDKHCVVPSLEHTDESASSKLENNVSEKNVNKKSQEFDTQHCTNTTKAIDSQREAVKSCCSNSQVVSFIWAVSRSLLPSELLGTPSNWRIMRRNIFKFIQLRRFEKFPLKLCLHQLKISRFPFLSNKYFLNNQNALILKCLKGHDEVLHKEFRNWNNDAHRVKHKLLEKWIFWYYSFLVVPLVQANFYVTESEHGKQDVYYYTKPVWEKLTKSTIDCLKNSRYSPLDDAALHNILRGRQFGFSKLRLQPKENGVRMVANLKCSSRLPLVKSAMGVQYCKTARKEISQKMMFKSYKSVNYVLRDAHTILKGIQFKEPQRLGSSVFDYNDVYKKLCPFLVSQKNGLTPMSMSLFIVTSDVLKAFDSVDQEKLLDIMKDVLWKNEYSFKQYDQVICTAKSLWVQKQFTMIDETSNTGHTQFKSFASSRHAVFVNQAWKKRVEKKLLFSNLKEHVKHNVLQFDGKFYLQGVGISQGGILSSLLCSLYYGHLERNVIFPFFEKTLESGSCKETNSVQTNNGDSSPCNLLMRFIDDFFFISNSKNQAASFFSRMKRGFRGYNCYMNEKKFGANFDVEQTPDLSLNKVYVGKDSATSFVRWSGLLINCSTMEIQADYTKYLNNHLSSALTVCWQGKPGARLKEKLCSFLRPKCHPLFFDSNINSAGVVRLNIYQMFLIAAMKFHCYIRDLSFVCKLDKDYCSNIIQNSLRYMHQLIKRRMHSMHLNSSIQPILKLKREEVEWLGFHAFIQVLKRKESRHKKLLAVLNSKLSSHRISRSVSSELQYAVNAENSSLVWKIKY